MKSRRVLIATIISMVGLVVTSCGGKKAAVPTAAAQPPDVVVTKVVQETVPIYSEFVGQTKADLTVDIRSRVQGVLEKSLFTEGAPVRKGNERMLKSNSPSNSSRVNLRR